MTVKVKEGKHNPNSEYKNFINPMDYKALADVFGDLREMFNVPIERAFKEFKKRIVGNRFFLNPE